MALSFGAGRYPHLRLDNGGAQIGDIALSLGERASIPFSSRCVQRKM
jgi:hypothetical protein